MKNYDELTNDLLERRNRYVTDQKRKRKTVISVATSLCCVCLVALLGIGVWQRGILGMVVIDGETYLQFFTDFEAYTLDACLGDASDYEGTYRTHPNDFAAKLYTAKEDSNVLIVKLGNGGTVVLKKVKQ